jgi:conjugative transfer signal peptidase TraF
MTRKASSLAARSRRTELTACAFGTMVAVTLGTAWSAGLRVNATTSMPRGLWQVSGVATPLVRGSIVTACLPDTASTREAAARGYLSTGPCPGGNEPLVKPVAAIVGDVVIVTPQGVAVNGQLVDNTAQRVRDDAGRPLRPFPPGVYPVMPGQVWLLSGHDGRSFDSRYFGPVPVTNVQGLARPLWVFE